MISIFFCFCVPTKKIRLHDTSKIFLIWWIACQNWKHPQAIQRLRSVVHLVLPLCCSISFCVLYGQLPCSTLPLFLSLFIILIELVRSSNGADGTSREVTTHPGCNADRGRRMYISFLGRVGKPSGGKCFLKTSARKEKLSYSPFSSKRERTYRETLQFIISHNVLFLLFIDNYILLD